MNGILNGIFTPFVIPTTDNGNINEKELRRYLRWLTGKGIHGLYANGSTGEFLRFTLEERRRLTAIAVEESCGNIPVLAGAAEPTLSESLASCDIYAALGCKAVSLCPPYYFRHSQEALTAYFQDIARKSPLPVVLYNIPAFTNALTADTIFALLDEPNIIGIKDSSRDLAAFLGLMQVIRRRRPDFACFTGTEEILLPALVMGADGGAIATSGIVPEAVLGIYNACKNDDIDTARTLQFSILPLIARMFSHDFPTGFRAGVAARGFNMGSGRQPLSDRQQEELTKLSPVLFDEITTLLKLVEVSCHAN